MDMNSKPKHSNDTSSSKGNNLLFSPHELDEFDKSYRKTKTTKTIFVILTSLVLVLGGIYLLHFNTQNNLSNAVNNGSQQSPATHPPLTSSIDKNSIPDTSASQAAEATAKADQAEADRLEALAQKTLSNANSLGQQSAANQTTASSMDAAYAASQAAYVQQQAASQAAQQQQAAQNAQCISQMDSATVPISNQIKPLMAVAANWSTTLRIIPYSSSPSSAYQQQVNLQTQQSQQLTSLQNQLSSVMSQYRCY